MCIKKIIKKAAIILSVIYAGLCGVLIYYNSYLPDSYYTSSNTDLTVNTFFRITTTPAKELSAVSGKTVPETQTVRLMLMGCIPVKEVEVQNIDVPMLIPGGNPFGLKMMMDGVMIIKTDNIETPSGDICPADNAGIKKGDIIKSINGTPVYSNYEIENIISNTNEPSVSVSILRDGAEMQMNVVPAYSSCDKKYKLGIWVRDSSAGIGTMTYIDRKNKTFGGLGHPVCDSDTGNIVPLSSGEIINVSISGIKKGTSGTPGELHGCFCGPAPCGTLYLNNKYGVFGIIDNISSSSEEIPMALKQEIKKGPALIYSTLDGDTPKAYDIEITEIDYNNRISSKNMIIKVTDKELLEKTGGIVQGMSGSPIIQDGKLAGAVTHVFVNDPSSGYAIFCESMYEMGKIS